VGWNCFSSNRSLINTEKAVIKTTYFSKEAEKTQNMIKLPLNPKIILHKTFIYGGSWI
jgi:hypothetical protein